MAFNSILQPRTAWSWFSCPRPRVSTDGPRRRSEMRPSVHVLRPRCLSDVGSPGSPASRGGGSGSALHMVSVGSLQPLRGWPRPLSAPRPPFPHRWRVTLSTLEWGPSGGWGLLMRGPRSWEWPAPPDTGQALCPEPGDRGEGGLLMPRAGEREALLRTATWLSE